MKKLLSILLLLLLLSMPVSAEEWATPPEPETGNQLLPQEQSNFTQDLLYVLRTALQQLRPELGEGIRLCLRLFCGMLLLSLVQQIHPMQQKTVQLASVCMLCALLLGSVTAMVRLGADTVSELSEYGKLLLPVMTAALAAQGGAATSAALYAGTAIFNSLLSALIRGVLIPMVYIFLLFAISSAVSDLPLLKKILDTIRWCIQWTLKTVLYVFVGYISITGVVSGTTDQMALKATKLTISGAVPVVGGILSDASEAVLVSMGALKNTAGIYGILAFVAILILPFLKIGIQYLLLKATAMLSSLCSDSKSAQLLEHFCLCMGYLLAMTGAVCLMLLISLVCFMKGVQL